MEDPIIIEVESDAEESGYFDMTPNESGPEITPGPSRSTSRNSAIHRQDCSVSSANSFVNSDKDHVNTNVMQNLESAITESFSIEEYIGDNSAYLDIKEEYLKIRKSENIYSDTQISEELVSKLDLCEDMQHMYWTQELLFGKSVKRVKSVKNVDEVELKTKIDKADLSGEMKGFLKGLFQQGIRMLIEADLLNEYVEIQAEKESTVYKADSELRIHVLIDILSLSDRPSPWIQDETKPPDDPDDPNDFPYLKVSSVSTRSKARKSLKKNKENTPVIKRKDSPISILNVISLRNSVPAQHVFKQYLARVMDPDLKTYLLVCHIGPLIEEWRMVLYQYRGDLATEVPIHLMSADEEPKHNFNVEEFLESSAADDNFEPAVLEKLQHFPTLSLQSVRTNTSQYSSTHLSVHGYQGSHKEKNYDAKVITTMTSVHIENITVQSCDTMERRSRSNSDDNLHMLKVKSEIRKGSKSRELGTKTHTESRPLCNGSDGMLSMEKIHKYWEEHEERLVYDVTELKKCLKYNIQSMPKMVKDDNKKHHKGRKH